MQVIQPKEAKRQQKAPRQTDHAVRPPSGKSAGAIPGGGLNGGGPGAGAGAAPFSGSGIFSFSPCEDEERLDASGGEWLPFMFGSGDGLGAAIAVARDMSFGDVKKVRKTE